MKRINIIRTLSVSTLVCLAITGVSLAAAKAKEFQGASAATLPTTIDLKDNDPTSIKSYYSSLEGKTTEQLQGTNLLKYLKAIINDGNTTYFTYSQVGSIYVITDRDWTNSPKESMSGYDSVNNKITSFSHSTEVDNNPYLHLLYCDYDVQGKTRYKGDADVRTDQVTFDKEHAWSQSHGFDNGTPSGSNLIGAGTDLHHLKAGTQYGNRTLHSNYSYGFVGVDDGDASIKYYETKNKKGTPRFPNDDDQQPLVFEPQDADKGDIARALLYMVACYNNYDGSTPTPENPALQLVNYVISGSSTGYSSENIENGYYGILKDLLIWHHMDPVDEFEIHRNNLIYNNYQHNRNPFIDYPQWVDYIWGTAKIQNDSILYDYHPTGSVDLDNDVINGYRSLQEVTSISITKAQAKTEYYVGEVFDTAGMVVTATYSDSSTEDVTENCAYSVDTSTPGVKTVTITYGGKSTTTSITVVANTEPVSSVSLNKTQITLDVGDETTLNATVLPVNASDKTVTWSSSDESVATVINGEVTAVSAGSATITVTTNDQGKTATCHVTVNATPEAGEKTDTLDRTITGVTGNTYTAWDNKTSVSSAVYVGQSAGGKTSIQLRATSPSGIVTTTSGGKIKSITVTWHADTTNGRYIEIFGKTTAYSSSTDLYSNETKGTSLGTIIKGTSTELTVTGNYQFIGIKASEPLYITSMNIVWITGTTANVPVEGINLSKNDMTIGIGETDPLVATILPEDATNTNVTWSSSNPTIATVTETGLVTGIAPGSATISATTEDGGFIAQCSVTVAASSPYANGVAYKFYLLRGDTQKRYYLNGGTAGESYYGDTTETYTDGIDLFFEQNGKGQNMYFFDKTNENAKTYITIVLSGTYRNFAITTATPTSPWLYDSDLNTIYVSISNAKYVLGTNSLYNYTTVGAYSSTRAGIYYSYVQETAESLSYYLLNKITCDNTGVNAPQFAEGYSWANLETIYNSLDESEKTILQTSGANQMGSTIEQAMARYDFILKKYKITTFNDFIGRNPQGSMRFVLVSKNNSLILAVMISSSILTSCLAAFLLLRKRKQR